MIVTGTGRFSEALAGEMDADFSPIETKVFPDGEVYIRFKEPEKLKGEKVILVSRGESPNFNPNLLVIRTLLALKELNRLNSQIYLVIPYMPYARQDKRFLEGEALSIETVRGLVEKLAEKIITVTSHDRREEGEITGKTYNIDGTEAVIRFLRKGGFNGNSIVMAPDMASDTFVRKIADELGVESLSVDKERDKKTGEIEMEGELPDLSGRRLIIYDDMISTGGTMFRAVEKGKKAGAENIVCVAIHPVLAKDSLEKIEVLQKEGIEFHTGDSIDSPLSDISLVEDVAERLSEIL